MRRRQIDNHEAQLFTAQTDSPAYYGFLNFFSSLIIFQNIVPISLYVSIEFVKTFQVTYTSSFGFRKANSNTLKNRLFLFGVILTCGMMRLKKPVLQKL